MTIYCVIGTNYLKSELPSTARIEAIEAPELPKNENRETKEKKMGINHFYTLQEAQDFCQKEYGYRPTL